MHSTTCTSKSQIGIAYHHCCTLHCLQNACERAESVLAILKVNLRKQLQQAPSLADGKRGARDDFLATPRLDADVVRSGVHFHRCCACAPANNATSAKGHNDAIVLWLHVRRRILLMHCSPDTPRQEHSFCPCTTHKRVPRCVKRQQCVVLQVSIDKLRNDELSELFEEALSRELRRHAQNVDVRSWVKVCICTKKIRADCVQ